MTGPIELAIEAADPAIWEALKAYCATEPRIPVSAKQAADRYARMQAAIAAYEQAKWRPIADAPKDGTSILISSENWRTVWRGYYRAAGIAMDSEIERFGEGWTRENYCDSNLQPTHFQPLPEPPKEPK